MSSRLKYNKNHHNGGRYAVYNVVFTKIINRSLVGKTNCDKTPKATRPLKDTFVCRSYEDAVQTEMPLFINEDESSPAAEMLKEINPDDLTPKQALEIIYQLKKFEES